ncbi:MAG TPA: phosphate ABC transporter substrate-binding protein PstS [Herpetosiphonaceae bacterium]
MRKTFSSALIGTMLAGTLAACGGGEATTAPTTAPTAATAPTTAPTTAAGTTAPMTDTTAPTTAAAPTEAATTAPATGSTGAAAALNPAKSDATVAAELKASGASFPAKIYQKWVENYKTVVPGVTINYQSVGSGQGVKDYLDTITDFGATDAYLTEEELAKAPNTLHIPTVAGAVVATYNLPDAPELQFSPETLADIFLGNVTKWNDPKIAADNPSATLPDTDITVVYRADGSGTNSIFTTYLSAVSPEFKDKVGAGKTVEWPVGQGEQKNDGVAKAVTATEGAIGYVELIYALGNKLPAPAIKNATGAYVKPTLESVTAAAQGFLKTLPEDLRVDIINPAEGAGAYPISGFTWIIVQKEQKDAAKAKALAEFIYWALADGDQAAIDLGFAPLPNEVKAKAVEKLEQITVDGTAVFKRP